MKPADLARRAGALLGEHGWQTRLAHCLDLDPRSVRRYAAGDRPVPVAIEAVIELIERVIGLGGQLPSRWRGIPADEIKGSPRKTRARTRAA